MQKHWLRTQEGSAQPAQASAPGRPGTCPALQSGRAGERQAHSLSEPGHAPPCVWERTLSSSSASLTLSYVHLVLTLTCGTGAVLQTITHTVTHLLLLPRSCFLGLYSHDPAQAPLLQFRASPISKSILLLGWGPALLGPGLSEHGHPTDRLPERQENLAAQHVEEVARGGAVDYNPVAVVQLVNVKVGLLQVLQRGVARGRWH